MSASLNSSAPGPCGQCELVLPVRTASARCARTSVDAQALGVMHIWQVTRCRPVAVGSAWSSSTWSPQNHHFPHQNLHFPLKNLLISTFKLTSTSEEVEQCATRESQRIRSPASAHSSVGGQSTTSWFYIRNDLFVSTCQRLISSDDPHWRSKKAWLDLPWFFENDLLASAPDLRGGLARSPLFNTRFIIFDTRFIILNAKFISFTTQTAKSPGDAAHHRLEMLLRSPSFSMEKSSFLIQISSDLI